MSSTNSTSSYSSSSELFDICRISGELRDPSKATSTSLAASRSAMITTILTSPFAVFLNGLILLAIYKNSSLRRQAYVILIALVFADLIRSIMVSPLFIIKEGMYQEKLEPSCSVILLFVNTGLFTQSELLLTAMTCERFIGVRYPIWHRVHITKRRLVKVAVACCIVGFIFLLLLSFITEKALIPIFVLLLCSSIATISFAVLTWRTIIKKTKEKHQVQSQYKQNQINQPVAEGSNCSEHQSQSVSPIFIDKENAPRLKVSQKIEDSNISVFVIFHRREQSNLEQDQTHTQGQSLEKSEFQGQSNSCENNEEDVCLNYKHRETAVNIKPSQQETQENTEFQGKNPEKNEEGVMGTHISENNTVLNIRQEQENLTSHNVSSGHENPKTNADSLTSQSTSNHVYRKSERKAARLATYLAMVLLFTRILPFVLMVVVTARKLKLIYIVAPLNHALSLSASLVNPVLCILTNPNIKKACLKLLKS